MKLTGGQIILKYLEKEKVPYILGIPGHGILSVFEAIRESDTAGKIKYLQVKHEQTAVHIADGYFRVSGKPLAVFTSIGPGALNTAIGLGTAYVDSSAVFQVSGDTHVNMKGVGVLQEIERYQDSNFIRALEPITKRSWRVEAARQLPRIMQRAFNQMLTGRKGPVLLSLPMDVQANSVDVELPEPSAHKAGSGPAGEKAVIDVAVEVMKKAKRPVILAGGAMLCSGCHDKLVKLAELWGAAVVTTMAGKSAFPEDHALYGFHTGSKGTPVGLELTRKADVVLALGTRFADETTCSYRKGAAFNFPQTKLIHVDIEAGEIGKNYPCDVGILGDLRIVIDQLIEAYQGKISAAGNSEKIQYAGEILDLKKDWKKVLETKRCQKFEKITISQLIGKMGESLPEDTIIVTSSGNTQAQLFQEYCFKKPQTHLTTGGFSTMGWALPAAIGAKLAKPNTPVVAFMGDGDFLMVMQELSTIAQYNIPVVVLLANNSGWMAIKDLQNDVYGDNFTFGNDWIRNGKMYTPDFAEIAKNFGIHSQKISQESEVDRAIKTALGLSAPAFIEVDVYREYPQSGGEAFGWWDLPIPAYMEAQRKKYEAGVAEEQI
jgi:acetolactate synthase-1/2/3 large subunit